MRVSVRSSNSGAQHSFYECSWARGRPPTLATEKKYPWQGICLRLHWRRAILAGGNVSGLMVALWFRFFFVLVSRPVASRWFRRTATAF